MSTSIINNTLSSTGLVKDVAPTTGPHWQTGSLFSTMGALAAQISFVQALNAAFTGLAAKVQQLSETQANYWINLLNGTGSSGKTGDLPNGSSVPSGIPSSEWPPTSSSVGYFSVQQIINWITTGSNVSTSNNQQSSELQTWTNLANVYNTQYNQDSSRFSGISSAVNQTTSNISGNVQTILQEYTQGPLALLQQIARLL